jgi:hypothetical protein
MEYPKYPSPADIAEMKARGYDPVTIAKAKERSLRWTSAQEVIREIEAAFAGVTLGNGVGLREAQGLDDYADKDVLAKYREGDEKEDWHRISTDELCACNSSLSFFDAEGMRFHLPAFMIAELRGEYGYGMDFQLTHLSDLCMEQYSWLSPEQRAAVRSVLRFLADGPEYERERGTILRALDGYWSDPPTA